MKKYTVKMAPIAAFILFFCCMCSRKQPIPSVLEPAQSSDGVNGPRLSRFDLVDYDPYPSTSFILSYKKGFDAPYSAFFKTFSFPTRTNSFNSYLFEGLDLSYNVFSPALLDSVSSSSVRRVKQAFFYQGVQLSLVRYTTITDTGAIRFSYDAAGRLTSYLDSLKSQNVPAVRTLFELEYASADPMINSVNTNPQRIYQSRIDNSGGRLLQFVSDFKYDSATNPFFLLPVLLNFSTLRGGLAVPFQLNNVVSYLRKQLVFPALEGGGTSDRPDTVLVYSSSRSFEYNAAGFPVRCVDRYNDQLNNITGRYVYSYSY